MARHKEKLRIFFITNPYEEKQKVLLKVRKKKPANGRPLTAKKNKEISSRRNSWETCVLNGTDHELDFYHDTKLVVMNTAFLSRWSRADLPR